MQAAHVFESLRSRGVEHDKGAEGVAVVHPRQLVVPARESRLILKICVVVRDGSAPLLPRDIPQLQAQLLASACVRRQHAAGERVVAEDGGVAVQRLCC
jgi:hypothetical protein